MAQKAEEIEEKKISPFAQAVYDIVQKIPRGRVMTYGQIAFLLIAKPLSATAAKKPALLSRAVAGALHRNPDPEHIPCHRVVHHDGSLARGFAFGGIDAHAKKLRKENIRIHDNRIENFGDCVIQG